MDDSVTLTTAKNVVCISTLFDYNETLLRDKHQNLKPDLNY